MSTNIDDIPIKTRNDLNTFDQVPIGNAANKFNISQYADGYSQQTPPPTINMTMEQKIQSKVVKIKLQGLEEFKTILADPQKSAEVDIELSKILKENNPACLEKALLCAQKWMDIGRSWSQKEIKEIIENGYINGKGATKKLATDLLFKAFDSKPEQIERTLLQSGLKNKVPKIVGGYLSVINQLLQQFGIKDLKYLKPYIPTIVNIMNNQKLPAVKTEGMNLFKSGMKWLGKDFLWPMFSELKDNMKKQLESFWEGHDKSEVMKANRQKNVPVVVGKSDGSTKNKSKQADKTCSPISSPPGLDIYQISDPIDILAKYDQKWTQSVLSTQKWSSKTCLLNQLISKSNIPKIANTEHRHITQMIRRLTNDSNFNVVLCSLKLAGILAKGLRKNYTQSAKLLFPYITIKLRDKKTQMIQETIHTLNCFCFCISVQDVAEDVKTGLRDKTAGMKNYIIKWIVYCLERGGSQRTAQFFRSSALYGIVEGLLNDPTPEVRDSAVRLVCKTRNIYGQSIFKGIDKTINNKQILQKLQQNLAQPQQLQKSRSRQNKSQKGNSKNKQSKKQQQYQQQSDTQQKQKIPISSYTLKQNINSIDITEQLSKNMKKLNDNTNWQNRKESADKLIKYFGSLHKDKPRAVVCSQILGDFMGVLKIRIADPNKQLIKIFVALVAEVFKCLTQKQAKIQAKLFIQELIQAFSDKNETNRKQICKALDSISSKISSQLFFPIIGQILNQQSSSSPSSTSSNSVSKQYILQYVLTNENFLTLIDQLQPTTSLSNLKQLKQYPKVLLLGLCDKSKDLRSVCQKIYKIMSDKVGVDVFKAFVNSKDMKTAFKGDLLAYLDKNDGVGAIEQPSMMSNGSNLSIINKDDGKRTPSASKGKFPNKQQTLAADKSRRKLSNAGSLANSRSKGKNNSILGQQSSKDYTSNLSFLLKETKKIIQGSQPFAPLQTLTSQRTTRTESTQKYRSIHPISQQSQIQQHLCRLVHYQQLYIKMYSNDYTKNIQAIQKLIKLCRDVAQTSSIRQLYDLFIKWVVIKIYGGNVPCIGVVELIVPLLTVLEKKRVVFGEVDVEAVVYLVREYLVTLFYQGSQNLETLKTILKLTIALSSGERTLKKLLSELKLDITSVHRHTGSTRNSLGLSCNKFYKKQLVIICGYFIEYFSNDQLLEDAASIPQLAQDQGFVRMLCSKFQEAVLREFGFKIQSFSNHFNNGNARDMSVRQMGINLQKSFHNADKNVVNSSLNSPRGASPAVAFFGGDKSKNQQQKSKKITPQKMNSTANQAQSHHFPPPSPINKTRLIPDNLPIRPQSINQVAKTCSMQPFPLALIPVDSSPYPHPSPHNPLLSNLHRLFPYSQQSIHFFSTLFQPQNQSSDKISSQLSTYSNLIYISIYNTLLKLLQINNRDVYGPEKIGIFMGLAQQMIRCQNVFKWVDQRVVERTVRGVVEQLVFQDQNRAVLEARLKCKFGDFKGDVFVKGVNGVMLRLLDNSYPLLLVNIFLYTIMQVILQPHSQPNQTRSKKLGLLIRCLNRLTTTYFCPTSTPGSQKQHHPTYNIEQDISCIKQHHVNRLLLLTRQYLHVVQVTDLAQFQARELNRNAGMAINGNNNEDSVILCICKILRILNKKNLLSKSIQQIKKQKPTQSLQILQSYLLQISNSTQLRNEDNQQILHNLNLNPNISNQTNDSTLSTSTFKIDEEMKKIVQMLSKNKTFSDGVKALKMYIQQSGGKFDYKAVFLSMNFQGGFVEKVAEEMGKLSVMAPQVSSRSLNPDIQNKLQRLKQKLQCINNEHSNSTAPRQPNEAQTHTHTHTQHNPQTNLNIGLSTSTISSNIRGEEAITPRGRDVANRSIEHSTQNDLKRRIEEMKNKVSLSTNKIR